MRVFKFESFFTFLLLVVASNLVAFGTDGISTEGIDMSPMKIKVERAYPNLRIERPLMIDHANDGSGRLFIASQLGTIHIVGKDEQIEEAPVFLDIKSKVAYRDDQNEEGFLGLAFHPKFKSNGHLFVYYTTTEEKLMSVISRFTVSKDDPNVVDPNSEVVLMKIKQPYWNHNGGTIAFGPNGYLYVGLGDGGLGKDPLLSAQDLSTWLGKILRIDVDNKTPGFNYAIPKDNPFVDVPNAKPEIFAYGFRNIWRMAFDRKTGDFWVADVGQDLWEEVNLVTKGGNYGWSIRESAHPFYQKPGQDISNLIDPVWEYPHDEPWGKSITGGLVYRGTRVPSLVGYYLYADYVSGRLWVLKYDPVTKKVVENRKVEWKASLPIVTFGETEDGEVLFSTTTSGGRIFRYVEDK
jgi:glucose/arabinose dehydrogenase